LVSGAGGSIGSELCNQILKFTPKKIILFEICEYFIYQAENNLKDQFPNQEIICVVGDIRDESRVNETFSLHSPDIVFHAAAYKHVPMMESNPLEAVKTNIKGTLNLAQASIAHKVKKFVMISTDKAVNPTNIMGATKRVAEMICQSFQMKNITEFIVLRFGNVLGSAGSVIPRFLDQIKAGGPVTVTHPEITRYFMSIPEATQLVLQAGALGRGGEIYILDMGQPVKIIDLARDLILLAGFKPGEDIEIKITGLRPGEKLYEELLADTENTIATEHKLVRVAKARQSTANFHQQLNHALANNNAQTIRLDIQQMVPEYEPKGV
jgi:FlaA1/EpsC-like NDP-sugar epimerase